MFSLLLFSFHPSLTFCLCSLLSVFSLLSHLYRHLSSRPTQAVVGYINFFFPVAHVSISYPLVISSINFERVAPATWVLGRSCFWNSTDCVVSGYNQLLVISEFIIQIL